MYTPVSSAASATTNLEMPLNTSLISQGVWCFPGNIAFHFQLTRGIHMICYNRSCSTAVILLDFDLSKTEAALVYTWA